MVEMFTAFCHMRGASYTKIHIDVSPLIEPREQLRKQKEEMSKPFFYISYDKAKTSISYLCIYWRISRPFFNYTSKRLFFAIFIIYIKYMIKLKSIIKVSPYFTLFLSPAFLGPGLIFPPPP